MKIRLVQHDLYMAYSEATLNYIKACKKAGIWDDAKRLEIMLDQIRMQRYKT